MRNKKQKVSVRQGELPKKKVINNWQHVMLALGVTVCLLGALVMVMGESILGENHTGIATVIGIVGIGLIANSSKRMAG